MELLNLELANGNKLATNERPPFAKQIVKHHLKNIFILLGGILVVVLICLGVAIVCGIHNQYRLYRVYNDVPSPVPIAIYLPLQLAIITMGWLWGWHFLRQRQDRHRKKSRLAVLTALGGIGTISCFAVHEMLVLPALLFLTFDLAVASDIVSYLYVTDNIPAVADMLVMTEFCHHTEFLIWRQITLFLLAALFFFCLRCWKSAP